MTRAEKFSDGASTGRLTTPAEGSVLRSMLIWLTLGVALSGAIYVLGGWIRFEYKLAGIVRSPAVKMRPVTASPHLPEGELKEWKLDNVLLRFPARVSLKRASDGQTGFWEIVDAETGAKMTLVDSRQELPGDFKALSKSFEALGGSAQFASVVQVMESVVQAEPVSWWDRFRFGEKEFYLRIAQATLKSLMLSNMTSVQVYRRGDYRFMVFWGKGAFNLIDVANVRLGTSQYAVFQGGEKAGALEDAFLCSYEIRQP